MIYFPEPHSHSKKFESYVSIYATKFDLKNPIGINISKFAKKVDLASLKSNIFKLDIYKLETSPIDLNKLSSIVKNVLVGKVNDIQTNNISDLVKETDYYNTRIEDTGKKIPNHDKYITTCDFIKFSAAIFDGKLKQAKLATNK